jgi:carboxymethylenebutenolidase
MLRDDAAEKRATLTRDRLVTKGGGMQERKFDIATDDGAMNTFVCHPEEGGPFPAIFFFHDAPGIREELFEMARRIGTSGYYVIMPNIFYRSARHVVIDGNRADVEGAYDRALMLEMILSISNAMAVDDARAVLATVAKDSAAKSGPIGAVGYCMGGRFAICAAAEFPEIAVTAAYCATAMVTDKADSPHLMVSRIKGEVYFGCGEADPLLPPDHIAQLRENLKAGAVSHRIEIYPGTGHAFAFRDRDAHVQAVEDRHWERMLALFREHVG